MKRKTMKRTAGILAIALAMGALLVATAPYSGAQTGTPAPQKRDKQPAVTRLRVEVTGGEDKKPVADASVYVRWYADRKSQTGKTQELNLKTNQEGVARSPDVPQGKILVQIIAPGWKTYGEWFDVQDEERTIPILLLRPATKWY